VKGQAKEAFAAREVVVSGGSVNSPKLLELSGIGRPDVLGRCGIATVHELPGVGENLRDHYSPRLKFAIADPDAVYSDKGSGWRLVAESLKYGLTTKGFIGQTTVPMRLYFRTREGLDSPDATFSVMPFITERVNRVRRISRVRGVTLSANVLRPESRGSIHIRSADPAEAPAIRFNFLSAEMDRTGLLAAMRIARTLMATEPLASIVGGEIAPGADCESDAALLDWVRHNAETTYHPVGTCRMGQDSMAVVDERLRVRGIAGLRVADGSIMPTLTSGNTNAPCMMIGEKAAAMLLEDAAAADAKGRAQAAA